MRNIVYPLAQKNTTVNRQNIHFLLNLFKSKKGQPWRLTFFSEYKRRYYLFIFINFLPFCSLSRKAFITS